MIVSRLAVSLVLLLAAAQAASACPSDFDPGFNGDGIAEKPVGLAGGIHDVAVTAGNQIYVAGAVGGKPAILRYSNGGSFDESFGEEGVAGLQISGEFTRLSLLANGDILAAGTALVREQPGKDVFVPATILARFDSTGQPDDDFGDDGTALVRFGDQSFPHGMIVRSDGVIVVVGQALVQGSWRATLYYFESDGDLSAALGAARALPVPVGSAIATSVVETTNNGILVAGTDITGGDGRVFLAKLDGNGALVPSYGKGGIRILASPKSVDQAWSIAKDAAGRIYVAGTVSSLARPNRSRFIVRRFLAGGARDVSYGRRGRAMTSPGGKWFTRDLEVSDEGVATLPYFRAKDGSYVLRFGSDGQRDLAFGHLGLEGILDGFLKGIEVQASGKIVVAGTLNGEPHVIRLEGGEWDGEEACVRDCGNGDVEHEEECDDGNVTNGDGCSAGCTIE